MKELASQEKLYQITTPRFCGGVVAFNFYIAKSTPCFKWAVGKHINYVVWYCQKQKWKIEEVKQ